MLVEVCNVADEAIEKFIVFQEAMVTKAPMSLSGWLKQARKYQQQGQLLQAVPIYQQILKRRPRHAEASDDLGMIYVNQGRVTEALPLLKTALEAKPADVKRWLRYADALMRANKPQKAQSIILQARRQGMKGDLIDKVEAQIRRMVAIPSLNLVEIESALSANDFVRAEALARAHLAKHPNHPSIQYFMGLALYQQNRSLDALPYLQQASSQLLQDVNAHNVLALCLKQLGRNAQALKVFKRVLTLAPNNPAVYSNMGSILNKARKFDEALAWMDKGMTIDPRHQALRANKAQTLLEKNRIREAETLIKGLLDEGYRNHSTLETWARIRHVEGDLNEAMACFEEAEQMGGMNSGTLVFKGSALSDLGHFEAAIDTFNTALAIDPAKSEALAAIAHARKMTKDDQDWWERAKASLAKEDLTQEEAFNLHYAMGKFCNDIKDYDQAFAHYQKANSIKSHTWSDRRYDRENLERVVSLFSENYNQRLFKQWHDIADPSARPLFIVGMPRSGTSLIEQILASHPLIYGAGELTFWNNFVQDYKPAILYGTLNADLLQMAARKYLDHLAEKFPDGARVVDKMPGNFLWVGLIHSVFPNARILHTMRNPVDNSISVFFQNFSQGHPYANDLDDIAHYYRQYHRLMQHWRRVMPADRFLDLPYEQLIEDQEGWSRKIIDFVGLEWDDSCLEFYKTKRKIGTASNWQARQPIYKSSRERWRNYEKFVGPLLPLLELYDLEKGQIGDVSKGE